MQYHFTSQRLKTKARELKMRDSNGAPRLTQLMKMDVIAQSAGDGNSLASVPISSGAVMNFPVLNRI